MPPPDRPGLNEKEDLLVAVNAGRSKTRADRRWMWYLIDRSACFPLLQNLVFSSPKLRIAFVDGQNEIVHEEEIDLNKVLYGVYDVDREQIKAAQLEVRGAGRVGSRNDSRELSGLFPYLLRFSRILHLDDDQNRYALVSDVQSSEGVFQHIVISPFFIFSPNVDRIDYGYANYYGDSLDIPYQTHLSLDDLKRIVAIRCSLVDAVRRRF